LGPIAISGDGTISQNGTVLSQIQVTQVPDTSRLTKVGHGMFQAPSDAMESRRAADGQVRQGQLEGAAVDPVQASVQIMQITRDVERNFGMIRYHDQMIDRAVNTLGRIA